MPRSVLRFAIVAVLVCLYTGFAMAQTPEGHVLQGTVLDSAGKPVGGATVKLQNAVQGIAETQTDAAGAFQFSGIAVGTYQVSSGQFSAGKADWVSGPETVVVGPAGQEKPVKLLLSKAAPVNSSPMEFADAPDFAVAGVTDWTAAGGHGSDSTLRTSEDLAREALALHADGSKRTAAERDREAAQEGKLHADLAAAPGSFAANHELGAFYLEAGRYGESLPLLLAAYRIDPSQQENEQKLALAYEKTGDLSHSREHIQALMARRETGDLHHLLAEVDEEMGDSVSAVHEDEQAVRLSPSEANYFAWGSELLLHRAIWQATEVFAKGSKAYPNSARMLAALGTTQFAGALYEQAARSLCSASDLDPADPQLYQLLSKIEMAAPGPLGCVEPRLARFVQQQPGNAAANYDYAMTLWKRGSLQPDDETRQRVETLLKRAVALDPKCAVAYLQLGLLRSSQHQAQEAIEYYRKAIDADSQLSEAHYRLAVAYDRLGMAEKAKQEFALHDQLEKAQAAAVERQRREVKQFLVVLEDQPGYAKSAK
jgi:tetratricopeptide (TPR) repeat protein